MATALAPEQKAPAATDERAANYNRNAILVLIVDDHDLIRLGLRKLLSNVNDIKIVGEASSGEQAVRMARELSPHVVLMDLKMPGIGGLEATHKLLRANPDIKVIAVTACDEEPFPYRFVRAGAAGYITKNTNLEELVTAIRKVHAGQPYITPEIAQKMALRQVTDAAKSPFAELSERELQVMWMITHGERVQQIADKLCLSSKTVNTYRYRLFEKLKVKNDVELTHLALRYGMLDKDLDSANAES